jgi:hypothetical protein
MATPPVPPNQLPKPLFGPNDGVSAALQAWLSQVADTVNTHSGYNGPVGMVSHLSLGGNRLMDVGEPVEDTDAISSGVAEENYSAGVIGPQLEASGSNPLKSVRRISDPNQRETSSSYMNDLMSSVPSANEIYPLITNEGGNVQVVIPASLFTFADSSSIMLITRTDLLPLPAQYAIASISSSGLLVTVTTSAASGISAGQAATIVGVTPSSFDGTFVMTSATPPYGLTYQSSLGTLSGSGGYVQTNSVYYYTVKKRDPTVHLFGPYPSDTMQNRLQANFDGTQIVAVVVITNGGGQVLQSGGGGSPIVGSPTAGSFF